jgi:VanZ family protein
MLSYLLASVAAAVALLQGRPLWQRVAAAVITAPVAFALLNVLDSIAQSAYSSDDWVRDEVALVLVGTLMAAAAVTLLVRRRRPLVA